MFKFKKLAAVLVLTAVATIGAAGCGGDDNDDSPPATPVETTTTDTSTDITKDELITQGDDICAEVNAAVGTISSSTTADDSIKETQISDIYTGMAERLEELGTPTDGDAPDEVIDAAKALADSGSSNGDSALTAFQSAATEYGFSECGDAPAAPSSSSTGTETEPSTSTPAPVPAEPAPATPVAPAAPAPTAPQTGGGVAPTEPSTGSDGSSGNSSGGIGPG